MSVKMFKQRVGVGVVIEAEIPVRDEFEAEISKAIASAHTIDDLQQLCTKQKHLLKFVVSTKKGEIIIIQSNGPKLFLLIEIETGIYEIATKFSFKKKSHGGIELFLENVDFSQPFIGNQGFFSIFSTNNFKIWAESNLIKKLNLEQEQEFIRKKIVDKTNSKIHIHDGILSPEKIYRAPAFKEEAEIHLFYDKANDTYYKVETVQQVLNIENNFYYLEREPTVFIEKEKVLEHQLKKIDKIPKSSNFREQFKVICENYQINNPFKIAMNSVKNVVEDKNKNWKWQAIADHFKCQINIFHQNENSLTTYKPKHEIIHYNFNFLLINESYKSVKKVIKKLTININIDKRQIKHYLKFIKMPKNANPINILTKNNIELQQIIAFNEKYNAKPKLSLCENLKKVKFLESLALELKFNLKIYTYINKENELKLNCEVNGFQNSLMLLLIENEIFEVEEAMEIYHFQIENVLVSIFNYLTKVVPKMTPANRFQIV
jgi:hypothetical protein